MQNLEAIVEQMESGELKLDDMIKKFEEGQHLIKFCSGKLDEVERKIEKLLTTEGTPKTEPFGDMQPETPPSADNESADEDESDAPF